MKADCGIYPAGVWHQADNVNMKIVCQVRVCVDTDKADNILDVGVSKKVVFQFSSINPNRFVRRDSKKIGLMEDTDGCINIIQDQIL
jgi:hypothetical protein